MYYIFFIHSSVDGHLYCLHVLAIVNSTVVNIWKHASKAGIFICFLLTVSLVPRTVPDSWLVLSKDLLNEAISAVFNVSLKTTTIVQQFWGCAVYGVAQSWTWLKRFSSSSSSSSDSSPSQSSWVLGHFMLKSPLLAAFHLALLKTIKKAEHWRIGAF